MNAANSRLHRFAAFTPNGDYLLLPSYHFSAGLIVQAVAPSSGAVRTVITPVRKGIGVSWQLSLPAPQEQTVLIYRRQGGKSSNPGGVFALDLRSGVEKPITSLTVVPWILFYERGVQLSLDGKLVMSQGLKSVQVCDWRADKRVFDLKVGDMAHAATADSP
jgi:hypothetical protein